MHETVSRRVLLGAAAGAPLVLAGGGSALAATAPRRRPRHGRVDDRVAGRLESRVTPLVTPYQMGVLVSDHRSGTLWGCRADRPNQTASLVKLMTSMATFLHADDLGRSVTASERAWMTRALRVSDNAAQTALWSGIGGRAGFARYAARMGLTSTAAHPTGGWGMTSTTPRDQIHVLDQLRLATGPVRAADCAWIQSTMAGVSGSQMWGTAPFGRAPGRTVMAKNGWCPYRPDSTWRLTSVGRVVDGSHHYSIAILSTGWSSMGAGVPRLNAVGSAVYAALGA